MEYVMSRLTAGAYVIAVEDTTTWDSMTYSNLYVLEQDSQVILVDAGLKVYQPLVVAALAEIGIQPDQVTHVLLTHGHRDHVEGAALFTNARKFIHSADWPMLASPLAAQVARFTPQAEAGTFAAPGLNGLEVVLVNTHSPGSVAIYDHRSQALFVGDFFCYFGEALPEGQLVTNSEAIKRGSCQYVAGQAAAGGQEFAAFMQGLSRLLAYRPEFFCTGHGVVLCEDIHSFLHNMWQSGTQTRKVE
ncbi:MBL fold metallo-hydrolase [uncultured Sporomusa sp.]|nr:MBL fold metallo-hydrolase [uncultured Sporomusa sp.]